MEAVSTIKIQLSSLLFLDHFGAIDGMNHARNANLKKKERKTVNIKFYIGVLTFFFFDVSVVLPCQ